ncbi:MAG: hypothetical protein QM780_01110 [Hyphomicrobium sp.]|uniref:hypothetical protein n=1 Tax=Hyphomicrobium sp. TaxID=82 RepID=UPI0039E56FA9
MRFKTITVLLGAVVASSFFASTKFGAGNRADAADAIVPPPPEVIRVPEFVPVVNFSEFVLAMQTFAAESPAGARLAAEALSAKFDAPADEAQKPASAPPSQQAAAQPAKPASVIVTRPVYVADIPSMPDPRVQPSAVADPVKIITPRSEKRADAGTRRHKSEKKVAAAAAKAERQSNPFEPAMGLGMVIDSAENAPPMSSLTEKKRKSKPASQDAE